MSLATKLQKGASTPQEKGAQTKPQQKVLREILAPIHRQRRKGQFGANLACAWEAIWANGMSSLLTMLGIIIGTAAIVASLNMTQGVSNYITDYSIQNGGATRIIISGFPTNTTQNQRNKVKRQNHSSLTSQDLQALRQLPHVTAISPAIILSEQAIYNDQKWSTQIFGTGTDFMAQENFDLAEGNWFNTTSDTRGDPVAVLGDTVANKLFSASGEDPIGKNIRVRGQILRVIGVFAPRGIYQLDNMVVIPFKAVQNRLTNDFYFTDIILSVDDISNVDQATQNITASLKHDHQILGDDPIDFTATTSAQQLQQSNQTLGLLGTLFAGIAAISLGIGGIVIMNIMLISVTERTREIGIRMALGARQRDILSQFLSEALGLCLIGGGIGTLFGCLIGWLLSNVMIKALGVSGQVAPFSISLPILLVPFLTSLAIGVVFGIYPAIRASRLEPIIAIRLPK